MRYPFIITKILTERRMRKAGCCRDFRLKILRARNREELLDVYTKGIRFCMHHDFPDIAYLNRHWRKQEYNRRGIFLSDNLEGLEAHHKMLVALGDCTGDLHYGEFLVRRLVAKHNARFHITADGFSILMVDICDNAEVSITAKDNARVVAHYYGAAKAPQTETHDTASIKVIHRPIIK